MYIKVLHNKRNKATIMHENKPNDVTLTAPRLVMKNERRLRAVTSQMSSSHDTESSSESVDDKQLLLVSLASSSSASRRRKQQETRLQLQNIRTSGANPHYTDQHLIER